MNMTKEGRRHLPLTIKMHMHRAKAAYLPVAWENAFQALFEASKRELTTMKRTSLHLCMELHTHCRYNIF